MKTAFLLLMLGMSAWGQGKPIVRKPVPKTNPQVMRLADFAKNNSLVWAISVSSSDEFYCVTISPKDESWSDRVECEETIKQAVDNLIYRFRQNPRGNQDFLKSEELQPVATGTPISTYTSTWTIPEPFDVPAVKVGVELGWNCDEKSHACVDGMVDKLECADKERIGPFWSKDGKSHCLKFPKERP